MWGNWGNRALLLSVVVIASGLSTAACSGSTTTLPKRDGGFEQEFNEAEEEFNRYPKGNIPTVIIRDAAALASPAARFPDGGASDGGRSTDPTDAGTVSPCGPLAVGDLAVVEMMIASVSGAGDKGEWFEVQNTRNCTLTFSGIAFESPRGSATDRVEIADTIVLAPRETFVIGGQSVNVGGKVFHWALTDVLKNSGDTIRLVQGSTVIEETTYPGYAFTTGVSLSFPAACKWSDRTSWERWSASFNEWQPSFKGTPNADNTDVACY